MIFVQGKQNIIPGTLQIFSDILEEKGEQKNRVMTLSERQQSRTCQTFIILKTIILLFLHASNVSSLFAPTFLCLIYKNYCTYLGSLELDIFLLGDHSELEFKIQSVPPK